MAAIDLIKDDRVRFEYARLSEIYGTVLTKLDLVNELQTSERKVDVMVANGTSPKFKRLGGSNSRIMFRIYDVAVWICGD